MSTASARRRVERARAQLLRAEIALVAREAEERSRARATLIVRLETTPLDQLTAIDQLALTSHRINVAIAEATPVLVATAWQMLLGVDR